MPMARKFRNPSSGSDEQKIVISKTIADRVVKDRVSILTSDAQVDSRFSAGDSIRFHGIKSAMCAPLWIRDKECYAPSLPCKRLDTILTLRSGAA